jgi:colanic acid biosynthesis protein WcaH
MERVDWVPSDDWETVVRNVPIVSVDLIVRHNGGVVLGKRENEPVSGMWFIPGGRVCKGEKLTEAVHRIAETELGIAVEICESLGVYEHFYEHSDIGPGIGKHYVAHGFVVDPLDTEFTSDGQHTRLQVFQSPPDELHQYTKQYLKATPNLNWW